MAATASYPVALGRTLTKEDDNFMPPSIGQSTSGYLHSNSENNTQWMLEYDVKKDDDRRGTRSSAQGFQGSQSAAKDYDCILVWDEASQSYILDRLSSTFTFKYDRGHGKLSEAARKVLSDPSPSTRSPTNNAMQGALGLDLADSTQSAATTPMEEKAHVMALAEDDTDQGIENDDDDESFARQLERGLEGFAADDETGKDSNLEDGDSPSPPIAKTGLGITQGNNTMQDSIITPRGSPYIDRPQARQATSKTTMSQSRGPLSSQMLASSTARSTPVVSPRSLANSPRPSGFDSTLPSSSSWKPPAQRSNVAIAYDEDEEEGDEESDDEEEDEEDDEEDDEVDLDAYARQLESSLQG